MNDKEKKEYLESYKAAKEKGVPFFPDIIFKDVVVSLLIFVILAALAYFVGVPMEARADPNDATYTPRPEWYFLFLFQLLKYFPGKLEVLGVMVIPGLLILLLFALPFIDRSPRRHFLNRPLASIAALGVIGGIVALTVLSVREVPPPQIAAPVDQAADLYAQNCANCHGPGIAVAPGTDLHQLIAQGKHEGMPAWGGDLSTDEIDALAGFITSSRGSALFTQYCGQCHQGMVQASGNPQELKRVFDEGPNYPPHRSETVANWKKTLEAAELNALLNFLAAPDGQRLFEINCSGCHGFGVAFTGTEAQLRDLISKGGQHVSMPAWQGTLSQADLETLAAYVTDPKAAPAGQTLFGQHCSSCHGEIVPAAPNIETARKIISTGGPHVTMPVWGNILTPEQLDALVQYSLAASKGQAPEEGARLFASNCSACHGESGQGGPNPGRPNDMIPPITSSEFLNTRDDVTLRNIISQGQPDLGMNPFGSTYGGQLSDDQISLIVAYMRTAGEASPAVEAPEPTAVQPAATTSAPAGPVSFSGNVLPIFQARCQACHNATTMQGGWNADSYDSAMTAGEDGPVVVAGDLENSRLAQLLLGTNGKLMPPSGALAPDEILTILDWIAAGAKNN